MLLSPSGPGFRFSSDDDLAFSALSVCFEDLDEAFLPCSGLLLFISTELNS